MLTSARNLSLLKQLTYAYTSERSRYALLENGIVYCYYAISSELTSFLHILFANIS